MKFRNLTLTIAAALLVLVPSISRADNSWKKELEGKLQADFPTSKVNFVSGQIKDATAFYLVQKPGIRLDRTFKHNDVESGQLKNQNIGGTLIRAATSNGYDDPDTMIELPVNSKVVITDFHIADDDITVTIQTQQFKRTLISGHVKDFQPHGVLIFHFGKDAVKSMSYDDVKAAINAFLCNENDPNGVHPGVVKIGMAETDMIRSMGRPKNLVDAGTKKIYVYQNLKITVVDGKISDVE